jgi:hypothetical protein
MRVLPLSEKENMPTFSSCTLKFYWIFKLRQLEREESNEMFSH